MIIDLSRFIAAERPSWSELEALLEEIENHPARSLSLGQARRFHFLYQKVSADRARLASFVSEPELRGYLESLIARAYAEIHESRARQTQNNRLGFMAFCREFPRVFRRHHRAFHLSMVITFAGVLFGGFAVALDPEAKTAVLPEMFANHLGSPSERVANEESVTVSHGENSHATFAGSLMVHNIKVSIFTLSLGMTFGIGTIVTLFYNGIILGLVGVDYIRDGQSVFLLGWLMPHGVIEIPAILIAGQGGLILGQALIGWSDRRPLRSRLRLIAPDLVTLIAGVALMLVWAGLIESFLSQHHQPVIPYWAKIAFGTLEFGALLWFLGWVGREEPS